MSDPLRSEIGAITVSQHKMVGMVTLRADISNAKTVEIIEKVTGQNLPEQRCISGGVENGLAWMSPDELLVFCADPANMVQRLDDALSGHKLIVDVSHARGF